MIAAIEMQRAFFVSLGGFGILTVIYVSAKAERRPEEGCVSMLEPFPLSSMQIGGDRVVSALQYPLDEVLRYA